MRYYPVPLELAEANALVDLWHRHHQPALNHRFSIGVIDGAGVLHGAAIAGRPVARMAGSPRDVAEVLRVATDGTENCCSVLYAAAARTARGIGYRRIQTYTLGSEPGTSLIAAGWTCEGEAGGGSWSREDRPRIDDQPTETKLRWSKALNERPDLASPPRRIESLGQDDLFGGAA